MLVVNVNFLPVLWIFVNSSSDSSLGLWVGASGFIGHVYVGVDGVWKCLRVSASWGCMSVFPRDEGHALGCTTSSEFCRWFPVLPFGETGEPTNASPSPCTAGNVSFRNAFVAGARGFAVALPRRPPPLSPKARAAARRRGSSYFIAVLRMSGSSSAPSGWRRRRRRRYSERPEGR